jgi:hypothetical protein
VNNKLAIRHTVVLLHSKIRSAFASLLSIQWLLGTLTFIGLLFIVAAVLQGSGNLAVRMVTVALRGSGALAVHITTAEPRCSGIPADHRMVAGLRNYSVPGGRMVAPVLWCSCWPYGACCSLLPLADARIAVRFKLHIVAFSEDLLLPAHG